MTAFVLDASVSIEYLLGQARADAAQHVLAALEHDSAIAPSHWRIEVMNVIGLQVARRNISPSSAEILLRQAYLFGVKADHHAWTDGWSSVHSLAMDHRLTAYDAAYLELAIRRSLPLATFDGPLSEAARAEKVPLLLYGG